MTEVLVKDHQNVTAGQPLVRINSGRTGIHELFCIDDDVRSLIHQGAEEQALRAAARRRGSGSHRAFPCPLERLQTERVATTGGTAAARMAGPSTASWPITHSSNAPIGK